MNAKKAVVGIMLWYVLMLLVITYAPNTEAKTGVFPVESSDTQKRLERYIKDKHIAEEIAKTKRPYIYAAIAKVESDFRPQIIGDGGDSHGMFQIQRKYHGWLGDGVQHQTDLCQRILEPLIARHGLEEGIRRYNGSGPAARRYSKRIIELSRIIERG
jgi:hypothetical protein